MNTNWILLLINQDWSLQFMAQT